MDDDGDRVLFFEIDGLTTVVRDCHDIDEIEDAVGFTQCPICGGNRKQDDSGFYLDHDLSYSPQVH